MTAAIICIRAMRDTRRWGKLLGWICFGRKLRLKKPEFGAEGGSVGLLPPRQSCSCHARFLRCLCHPARFRNIPKSDTCHLFGIRESGVDVVSSLLRVARSASKCSRKSLVRLGIAALQRRLTGV